MKDREKGDYHKGQRRGFISSGQLKCLVHVCALMYIECNVHQPDMLCCPPNDNGTKVCIVLLSGLLFCGISILWFSQLEKILYTKNRKIDPFWIDPRNINTTKTRYKGIKMYIIDFIIIIHLLYTVIQFSSYTEWEFLSSRNNTSEWIHCKHTTFLHLGG